MRCATCALVAGALLLGAAPKAAAQSEPDLVVNVQRSKIISISCEMGEPLARIRVAVDNIGPGSAENRAAAGLPAIVAAAAEHAPFTYVEAASPNNLDPGEIATVVVQVGAGVRKSDRIGSAVATGASTPSIAVANSLPAQRALPLRQRRSIQIWLKRRGFYRDDVDGRLGANSVRAIRAYQRARGEAATGVLTLAQMRGLFRLPPAESQANKAKERRRFRLVVIVDPKNLVAEINEDNNIWITPVQTLTDC